MVLSATFKASRIICAVTRRAARPTLPFASEMIYVLVQPVEGVDRLCANDRPRSLIAAGVFSVQQRRTIGQKEEALLFPMSHRAGAPIKWSCAFTLALLLCGCIADQKKQVATCEIDAKRAFPDKTWRGVSASPDMANFIQACMGVAGYDFVCRPEDMSLSADYFCYRPRRKLGQWAYETERWIKQHGF
jgi:hypothetical protein